MTRMYNFWKQSQSATLSSQMENMKLYTKIILICQKRRTILHKPILLVTFSCREKTTLKSLYDTDLCWVHNVESHDQCQFPATKDPFPMDHMHKCPHTAFPLQEFP